jgi:polysaccharide chain length determinant protein (PEP-CTERM system associated)
MNTLLETVYDEFHSAWRFRWIGLAAAAAVAIIGWIVVFMLPDRYEARASVFVDTRTALQPALQGLTVEQDVNVQLNYVRQSLLTGNQLEKIARDAGVLPESVKDPEQIAAALASFSERVVLSARSAGDSRDRTAGSIYEFRYQDPSRERSIHVIDTVLNHFVEETLGGKRRGSEHAQRFLESQIRAYEQRLSEAELRLAEFKKANLGLMPNEQGGYFEQLQAQIDQARVVENNLNVALSRRAELARQLRGDAVIGASGGAGGALSASSETLTRIREAEVRLNELLLRFTDRHPDVIAARATLAELNARRDAEIDSLRRGDAAAAAASGVSSSPVYQSIQLQLNQADVEIAALRNQLAQLQSKAAELRQRLDVAPQVEAQYAALNRDYDINKAQYEALLASYEKARLGEEADTAGSVRFEVVQPPTSPFVPVTPPRTLLIVGIFAGAMAFGGVLAFALHLLNPVVGSLRGLTKISDLPVIGVVSAAFPDQLGAKAKRQLLGFIGACGILFGLLILVLVLNQSGLRLGGNGGIA